MIVIEAFNEAVQWLSFSPCSRFAVASGKRPGDRFGGPIHFWSTSGEWAKCFPPGEYVSEFALNPDGRWAIGKQSSSDVTAFDMKSGQSYKLGEDPSVSNVARSPDGKKLLARIQVKDQPCLSCWRQPAGSRPVKLWQRPAKRTEPYPYRFEFFPGGERIATAEYKHTPRPLWRIAIRSGKTGDYLQTFDGEVGSETLLVTPDGRHILTRYGKEILVFSTDDLAAGPRAIAMGVKSTSDQFFHGTTVAHHPNANQFAITNRDKTATVFDTETGKVLKVYKWPVAELRSIAYSPDGALLAAGSESGRIVVWDVDG